MTSQLPALESHPLPFSPEIDPSSYLDECKRLILDEIREIVPVDGRHTGGLYELMLDYPLRGGKALRPAICISTCRALGGWLHAVVRSAAVLEFYHNAFLIHDDVEDGSHMRRRRDTLHRLHGVPIAVNVGDGMLALTLAPLLGNMDTLGMGRALRILQTIADMARESSEGQMLELRWVRAGDWLLDDRDYVRMVYKKSAWYTFVAPITIGAIAAGASDRQRAALRRFATLLGVAFQIHDDWLNLMGEEDAYGKELAGDLWEGKHTLMLIHAMRSATDSERRHALEILRKPRAPSSLGAQRVRETLERLRRDGEIGEPAARALWRALDDQAPCKTEADVAFLRELVVRYKGPEYARRVALSRARRAARTFAELAGTLPPSVHLEFLSGLVNYVVDRER